MNLQKPKAPYSQIIRNFCSRAELTEGLRKLYGKLQIVPGLIRKHLRTKVSDTFI